MDAYVNIDDEHIWEAVEGFVNDTIGDRLAEYVHDSDLECEVASLMEDKEVVTADMICDVTQFEARVTECEEAINNLYNKVNELESRTLRGRWDTMTCWIRRKFRG